MESALTPLAKPIEQQIILPTGEEKKRLAIKSETLLLCERVMPLLVEPKSQEEYEELGREIIALRITKQSFLKLWNPYVDEKHKEHRKACIERNAVTETIDLMEERGDRIILAYDKLIREQAARQQQVAQQAVNNDVARESSDQAQEQKLQMAIAAEESGNSELAEQILNTETPAAVSMPPTVMVQQPAKLAGFSKRTTWKGRLIGLTDAQRQASFELTLRAIVADLDRPATERRGLVVLAELKDSALNAMAKAMREQLNIPGCEAYDQEGLTKRV